MRKAAAEYRLLQPQGDALVTPKDPMVALSLVQQEVELMVLGRRDANLMDGQFDPEQSWPRLDLANVEIGSRPAGERIVEFSLVAAQRGNCEIAMMSGHATKTQIDRPASSDGPWLTVVLNQGPELREETLDGK
jgi:hypothetical protein